MVIEPTALCRLSIKGVNILSPSNAFNEFCPGSSENHIENKTNILPTVELAA